MSVDLTVEGVIATVVLNRPEKLNALSADMRQSLCDHFARLRYDDAVRVVIVTGAGRGFCSGADVDRMAGQQHDLRAGRQRLQQGGHTFIRALHAIEKPTIAAVRGPAVGIGWSIALACDLVIASNAGGNVLNVAERYVVQHHLGNVMSMSFGSPEAAIHGKGNNIQLQQADAIYQSAQSAGITVFASAGDEGATNFGVCKDCTVVNASFPASDRHWWLESL